MPFSALKNDYKELILAPYYISCFLPGSSAFPSFKKLLLERKKKFWLYQRGSWAGAQGLELKGYLLGVWLDHDVTIDENGTNDGKREEWMGEDMYGDPSDRMERREEE